MRTIIFILSLCWISCLKAEEWSFDLPPTNYYSQDVNADWRGIEGLGLTVQLVDEAPATPMLLSLFIQTEEGYWLESRQDLKLNGEIQRFELSFQEDSLDWRMSNGDRVFGRDLLRRVNRWGLRLYSAEAKSGVLRVGLLEMRAQPSLVSPSFTPRDFPRSARPNTLVSLMVEPWDWQGDLFSPAGNPVFEINQNGEQFFVPAVWVQEMRRRQVPGQTAVKAFPWRRPVFRAVWQPEKEGLAEVILHASPEAPTQALGQIQVSSSAAEASEPPLLRSPEDLDFWKSLPKDTAVWMKAPGMESWQPAPDVNGVWTPRLDWTASWGIYAGLGDFVQARAAMFEQWMLAADQQGPLRVMTENVLDNRSQLNWKDHPWNLANGGKHLEASFVWSDPAWMDLVVRRAVYLWYRYGAYEQATGLYIDVSRGSAFHSDWVNTLSERLQAALPGVVVYCPSPGLPERRLEGELVMGKEGWQKPDQLFGAEQFIAGVEPAGSVVLVGASPEGFDATVPMIQHWSDQQVLQLDLEAQFSDGVFPSMQLHVRTAPDRVFASRLFELHNRELNRVFIDLNDPAGWNCFQDPDRKWTPLERMNIRDIVLRVFSDKADPSASFKIHGAALVSRPVAEASAEVTLQISGLRQPEAKVKAMEMQEWIFDLNRFFQNPYNPEEIAVDLQVELPDGNIVSQPGFFFQQTLRSYENEVEGLALGENFDWRVRFRPWMDGPHRWKLHVQYHPPGGGDPVNLHSEGVFTAEGLNHARGFLLQSKQDPRYFEFQNGEFFYPMGHTMRSPSDRRPGIYDAPLMQTLDAADAKGTEIYADWFRRMQENGGNFARIWISNWWLGLEWNSRHDGYHGRKYFNQLNAARLDRLVDLAEQTGMYLNLETTNHGTFSTSIDREWDENPWSEFSPDEGPVRYASEFLDSEEAKSWHAYKMRYLVARVGHSPSVAFWGVLTESEWTEAYFRSFRDIGRNEVREYHPQPYRDTRFREPFKQWINQTAADFKAFNAHPSLATTHFSNPDNGKDFWRLPDISVIYNNAYSGFFNRIRPPLPKMNPRTVKHTYPEFDQRKDPFYNGIVREIFGYAEFFRDMAKDDRLVIIGEWGGRPTQNQDEHLVAEFHSGIWAAIVSELSGVGGFWWFNLVDFHDLFPQYAAASKFMAGEDLRGKNFRQSRWAVLFPESQGGKEDVRLALGKSTAREAFGYLYSSALSHPNRSRPPRSFDDKDFPLSGPGWMLAPDSLENGQYRVEFWNTFTGEIIQNSTIFLHPENREVAVPSHRVDLAVKIKYEQKLPPPTPTPMPTPTPTPQPTPTPLPPPLPTPLPPSGIPTPNLPTDIP